MEELIDILDENGNKTGEATTRKQIHEKGLWHRIIVVSIIDKNGHILMQQRSMDKESNPGKWDVSVAGHVSSGQTSIEAAIREVSEEVGIEINEEDLKYILTYKNKREIKENYTDCQIYDCYIVNIDEIKVEDIKIQESEVEQVKLCELAEVKELINSKKVMNRDELYKEIIKYLK